VQTKQSTRDHVFHDLTRSICPECGQVIDAQVLVRDGALYLRKRCPEHGWHEALVSSDADWNLRALKYNKPGAIPHRFASTVDRGCPSDCGLCPEHQQHTCIALVEVTSRCNLACPTCFANATPTSRGHDLSLGQVEAMLDRLLEAEGQPEVVQISGGEPTIHPQILEILAAAKEREIGHVMLNTNGVRLAQDRAFVRELAQHEPVIYLQFDGLEASSHETLRGRDLRAIKRQALDHLAEEGLWAVLVVTVAQGVNEHELGDILRFGLQDPAVLGINYQPVTFAGRCAGADPVNRITVTDVLHGLETQTDGLLTTQDFVPVPCPHPDCSACTYLYVEGEEITPLPRLINVEDYLDFIANRAAPNLSEEIGGALEALWSMAAAMGTDGTTGDLACVACGFDVSLPLDEPFLKQHFFMLQVHGFMDEHTMDLKRLMKCCIHEELLPDGRAVPFCAYNTLGYRQQVRRQQEGAK
jgi:uncharacterized radical SAM superfamily Fe-S cluster-containing enzyme